MFHGDHPQTERLEMIELKRQALGPIVSDTGVTLSEAEFLVAEIAEAKENRRTRSVPLIGIALMITGFSFASATPLSRIVAFTIGIGGILLGLYCIYRHTRQIKELKIRLKRCQPSN